MVKKITYLSFAVLVMSCSNLAPKSTIAQKATRQQVDTIVFFENLIDTTTSSLYKGHVFAGIKMLDTFKVYAKLRVEAYSLDSVIAFITLVNDENREAFSLYKPLLPNENLIENTFAIFDSAGNTLKFNSPKSTHQYISGSQNFMPAVIPDLADDNFLEFEPGEKLAFQINLSNYFYFKGVIKNGEHCVYIGYANLMPYVKKGKHLTMFDQHWDKERLLYIPIDSRNENFAYERLKVLLPDK